MRLLRKSPKPANSEPADDAAAAHPDDPPTVELAAIGDPLEPGAPDGPASAASPAEPTGQEPPFAEPPATEAFAVEPPAALEPPAAEPFEAPIAGSFTEPAAAPADPEPLPPEEASLAAGATATTPLSASAQPGDEPPGDPLAPPPTAVASNGWSAGAHSLAASHDSEASMWERPEIALASAFCAGLVVAIVLKRR